MSFDDTPASTDAPTTPPATTAPKPKRVYFSRFNLKAPLIIGGQARPDVMSDASFGIFRENPFIEVRLNEPGVEPSPANNWGKVAARMDPTTFGVFCDVVENLANGTTNEAVAIKNFNSYKGGEKFDTPQHINTTLVGKDDQGRIFFKIIEEGRPAPVFFFGPTPYHVVVKADKTELPAGEASRAFAGAMVRMLRQVINVSIARRDDGEDKPAEDSQPRQQRQGGWQGRGNNGGGGGYNRGGGGNNNWGNRGGNGGGWNNRGGNGGGWNNRGGNGGGYNRGGNGGGWQDRNGGGGRPAPETSVSDSDITF